MFYMPMASRSTAPPVLLKVISPSTIPLGLVLAGSLIAPAIGSPLPENMRGPIILRDDERPVTPAQVGLLSQQAAPNPTPTPTSTPGSRTNEEEKAEAQDALAKASQNPIANLISLPIQNNTNFGVGPLDKRTQNVLNIQPVIPVPLTKDLMLITRTIVPLISQPLSPSGRESKFGL